jgi:sporulation protein YlmC with PRC-barrel domain
MHRNFPLNAEVHGTDGYFGRSTHLVVNPANEKVTHIVVKGRKTQSKLMVPARYVRDATPDLILLNLSGEEIKALEPFQQMYFSKRQIQRYGSDPRMIVLWPYVLTEKKVIRENQTTVPPGALAVRRGARVKATDGFVGQVSEFIVDPETGYISHMILREGLPWDKKNITIAITEIDHIDETVVYLKLKKKAVKQLPAIQIRRP